MPPKQNEESTIIIRRQLLGKRDTLIQYLLMKVDDDDFHAVSDAACDVREIDAKLSMLNGDK